MNDKKYNFLIHHGEESGINCGFDVWCISDDTTTDPVFTGKNGQIAFKEIHTDEDDDGAYDRQLSDDIRVIEDVRRDLSDIGRRYAMTVVKTGRNRAELLPDEEKYRIYTYHISGEQYDESFEWYPLEPGDHVEVQICSIEKSQCFCSVTDIIDRFNKSRNLITAGTQKDRMNLDLQCMTGKALIQASVVDLEQVTKNGYTYLNLRMCLNNILLGGQHDISRNNEHIIGKHTGQGSEYMMWLSKPQDEKGKRRYYSLSFTKSVIFDKSMDTDRPAEGTTVSLIGTVYEFKNTGVAILVSCESPRIASRIYASDFKDPAKWGKFIKNYLPLGFPARFNLDVETGTQKHRMHLRGFNIPGNLKGRIGSDTDAQNLKDRNLKEHVLVTPHRLRQEDQAMLVTSPDYAGWAYFSESPKALINYAKSRIFTTEMKVPANVRIKSSTVVFNIKEALQDELHRLNGLVGQSEQMKICSIILGKVYLTTKGGYPVEYTCNDLREEELIRQNMFKEMDFIIENTADDWVEVNSVYWFRNQIADLGIKVGGYFFAKHISIDRNDRWHTLVNEKADCVVVTETLKENELLRENDTLMLIGYDMKARHLIAAAHPERFTDTGGRRIRVKAITDITPELWLCTDDVKLLLMHSTEKESSVLRHLKRLYGDDTYVDVVPVNNRDAGQRVAGCRFNGVACGFDYSPLFKGKAIDLPIPVSEQTPKVLFGDIMLTTTEDELRNGPMRRILPVGSVNEDGTMSCTRPAGKDPGHHRDAPYGPDVCKGIVAGTEEDAVVFDVDGKEVAIPDSMLHMDALDHDEICSIFSIGSEWALRQNGDTYEISTSCPKRIGIYTLIKQIGSRNRGRGRHDITWIVKHECGAIAETVIEDNGQKPYDRILLHSVDDRTDDIMTVIEPDYMGVKIPLILDKVEEDKMLCHRADGITLCDEYVIPKEHWSWYAVKHQAAGLSMLEGSAFMARLLEFDSVCATLDRRCLMRQYELLPESTQDGIYHMAVDGYRKEGYILHQNGVKALLPWHEVSLCESTLDEFIRKEFFRENTLIDVMLTFNHADGEYKAIWRTMPELKEKATGWKRSIRSRLSFAATVHHIGLNALYLDIEGIPMYLTSARLGLWEGDVLENHFEEGQYLDCDLECSNNGLFSVSIDKRTGDTDIPVIYSVHNASLVRYVSEDNLDCIVKFGKWFATVREEDMTWEPVAEGQRPYECGAEIPIRIEDIDHVNKKISASVIMATPKPESGPASEQWKDNPELRWFTFDKVNDRGHIWLKDEEGRPGIMFKGGDYTCATEPLIKNMKEEGGCWLALKGVKRYSNRVYYNCAYLQSNAIFELDKALKNTPAGENLIKKVTIRKVSQDRLLVSHGIALGTISAKECTGQEGIDLTQHYTEGSEIECVILDTRNLMFTASIVKTRPNGFADFLEGITVGSTVSVKVCRCDDNGVYVQICRTQLQGMIPCNEVSHNPDRDHRKWAEDWLGDFPKVVCTAIDLETGQILFSRKRMLAEGVEE